MNSQKSSRDLVKRFCDLMGRQNLLSHFLDWIAWRLLLPGPALALAAAGPAELELPRQAEEPVPGTGAPEVVMSKNMPPWNRPNNGTAWEAPGAGNPASPHDTPRECKEKPQYRGMHGRPCKFVMSGTDSMCPYGTQAGLFWQYMVSGVTYCYVDCCGIDSISPVWCNWTKELNWCGGKGNNKYTCTLSIVKSALNVGSDGYPEGLEQIGPPTANE